MSAEGNLRRARPVLRGILVAVAVVVLVGVAVGAWIVTGPGPLAFASGGKVTLANYHGPDPTGVPASLAGSDLAQRGA